MCVQTHTDGTAGSMQDNPDRGTYALIFGLSAVAMLVLQLLRGLVGIYSVCVFLVSLSDCQFRHP